MSEEQYCPVLPAAGKRGGFYYDETYKYAITADPDKLTNNIDVMLYWMKRLGYCDEAACAVVGCAQYESQMNPAAWEFPGYEWGPGPQGQNQGYGLLQWTPWQSILLLWDGHRCDCNKDGSWQMKRLGAEYEWGLDHPLDSEWQENAYGGISGMGWTWDDFKAGFTTAEPTPTIDRLVEVFQIDYLRGYLGGLPYKKQNAQNIWDGWKINHTYHPKNPMAWLYFKMSKLNRKIYRG